MKIQKKILLLFVLNLLLAVAAGASALAASRAEGGISDGGGSEDKQSGLIFDSYLDSHRVTSEQLKKEPFNPEKVLGEGKVSEFVSDAGSELYRALHEKPWYIVKFDKTLLRHVNEETKKKLHAAGFLRETTQRAIQTEDMVLIDQAYYQAQLAKVRKGTPKEKEKAIDNLLTLWIHEMVRDKEIKTRRKPGETEEQAIGKGGYHRVGLPPMSEANVLRLTAVLKESPKWKEMYCKGMEESSCDYNRRIRLQNEFVRNNYGYYLD